MVKSVRLACLMCAASVYPEPGSNSLVFRSAINFVLLCQISSKFIRCTFKYYLIIFSSSSLHYSFLPNLINNLSQIISDFYKSKLKCFFKLFKLLSFLAKKLLKNLLVRYNISFEIFSASVYSLKDFIVYFSMYFFVFSLRTSFIIHHPFIFVNTFF